MYPPVCGLTLVNLTLPTCIVLGSSGAFCKEMFFVAKYCSTNRIGKENLSSLLITTFNKLRRKLPSLSNKTSINPICSGGRALGDLITSIREFSWFDNIFSTPIMFFCFTNTFSNSALPGSCGLSLTISTPITAGL